MRLAAASFVAAIALGASTAHAQATTNAGDRAPGPGAPHATAGRLAVYRAQNAFVAHDLDTANTAYHEAQGQDRQRAEGTLGTGYVQAARNDVEGALASFRQAAQQAVAANDDLTRLRALQAAANTLEAAHRWSDAISAWTDFVSFATSHPSLGSAANGQARITAIRARDEREAAAAPVRERIAQRLQANAHPAPTTP